MGRCTRVEEINTHEERDREVSNSEYTKVIYKSANRHSS